MSDEIKKARKEALKKTAEGINVDKMKERAQRRRDDMQSGDYVKDIHGKMSLSPGKLHRKTKGHPYSVREDIRKTEEKKLAEWKERKKLRENKKLKDLLKKK